MSEAEEPLGQLREDGTIVFERCLPGPVEFIWDYIVDGNRRASWLAGGDMPLTPGTYGEMIFHHSELTSDRPPETYAGFDKPMPMKYEILACEPPHLIRFTWPDSQANRMSVVTIELTPSGDDVLLRLTHENVGHDHGNLIGLLGGWHTHLGLLCDLAADRPGQPFWGNHTRNEAMYERHYAAQLEGLERI